MKLILISPNYGAQTESFINEHFLFLKPDFILTGGYHPVSDENGDYINGKVIRILLKFMSYFFRDRQLISFKASLFLSLFKFKFYKSVVLIEYGTTAHNTCSVLNLLGLPFVVHFHGYDASVISYANAEYYKFVKKSAKGVFVVSKEMERDLIRIGFNEADIVYNPYGPRKEFEECNPNFKSKIVFALGRFVDKKAPYNLVIAFARVLSKVPDAQLIIAGDGPLMNLCKNLALVLGISDRVSFVGVINLYQTKYYMSKSQLFIQHSIRAENGDKEGMPLSILEAQLASLPVVATKHAGIVEIITDGVNGYLVDENDIDSFTKRIADLLVDSDLCRTMGAAARKNIMDNFPLNRHLNIIAEKLKLNAR